jgi:hypothetical protein
MVVARQRELSDAARRSNFHDLVPDAGTGSQKFDRRNRPCWSRELIPVVDVVRVVLRGATEHTRQRSAPENARDKDAL